MLEDEKSEVNSAYFKLQRVTKRLYKAEKVVRRLSVKRQELKEIYEKLDYKLALIDGRLKKVKSKEHKRKDEGLVINLTMNQILRIAEELDVSLER